MAAVLIFLLCVVSWSHPSGMTEHCIVIQYNVCAHVSFGLPVYGLYELFGKVITILDE